MLRVDRGIGTEIPPEFKLVELYFLANQSTSELAACFFEHFSCRAWKNRRGRLIRNWKVIAWQWIFYQ